MYHFEYLDKSKAKAFRSEIIELVCKIQDDLRDQFTMDRKFIGSSDRGMITYDPKTNIGPDCDINLYPNDDDENFSPEDLRTMIFNSINKNMGQYGYNKIENKTRVIRIKQVDYWNSRIIKSCDFAVVHDYSENGKPCQEYIRFNKERNSFFWARQSGGFGIEQKVKRLKQHGYWEDVRALYLDKKNSNTDPNKKSRSLYAEAVNEIATLYGY